MLIFNIKVAPRAILVALYATLLSFEQFT